MYEKENELTPLDMSQYADKITKIRVPPAKNTHVKGCGKDGCKKCEEAHPQADPHCLICGGSGFIHPVSPGGKPIYNKIIACPAKGCLNDTHNGIVSAPVFNKFTGLNRTKTFDLFLNIPGTEEALKYCKELAGATPGFYMLTLYGPTGNGKTHLAHAVGNEWVRRGFRAVRFYSAADLLNKYKIAIQDEDQNSARFIESIANLDGLIIDDLEMRYFKIYSVEIWEYIINARYSMSLPTIITTNNDIAELPEKILSRLSDKATSRRAYNKAQDYRITQGKIKKGE